MINTFLWAVYSNKPVLVKALLHVVNTSANNNYAIRSASRQGNTEIVKMLLADNRVNPGVLDNASIRWASHNGHIEIVRLLLADNRVDPSDKDNSAIQHANDRGRIEIVKMLKGAGCAI